MSVYASFWIMSRNIAKEWKLKEKNKKIGSSAPKLISAKLGYHLVYLNP